MKKFITLLALCAFGLVSLNAYELKFSDKNGENKISFKTAKIEQTNGVKFSGQAQINGQKAWSMSDGIDECMFDLVYKARKPEITDLDGDGIKEVWLIYYQTCVSDVSPAQMKILVYERKEGETHKYALRGETYNKFEKIGGEFKADFKGADPALLEHAKKLWNKYKSPKLGQD